MAQLQTRPAPPRPLIQDIDRHVGSRIRQRRIMLGLTQQQMADLVGVTYQQAHKYEKGINRVAGGRLYQAAQALGVEVAYFYEGLVDQAPTTKPNPQQRLMLELARNFLKLPSRRHQEAICTLARAMAAAELVDDSDLATVAVDEVIAA